MSSLMLALLVVAVPDGQEWFYPGAGDEVAVIEHGSSGLVIGGLPVERTGWLLARVADPEGLRALPRWPRSRCCVATVTWCAPARATGSTRSRCRNACMGARASPGCTRSSR